MSFIAVVANPPEMGVPETWLEVSGVHLTHITDGHAAAVFLRAGQDAVHLESDAELVGLLRSVVVLNDCPPEWVGTDAGDLWVQRSWNAIASTAVDAFIAAEVAA